MKLHQLLENTIDALSERMSRDQMADAVTAENTDIVMGRQQINRWLCDRGDSFGAPLGLVVLAAKLGEAALLREIADRAGYTISPKRDQAPRERIPSLLACEVQANTDAIGATLEAIADGRITADEADDIKAKIAVAIVQMQRLAQRIDAEVGQ
jgi:hypothetical protein